MITPNDPIGNAVLAFDQGKASENIIVSANLCEDDVIPVSHLFRTFDEMPKVEQAALELAHGRILDVGAAAGCHATYLTAQQKSVTSIDISPGCVKLMKSKGLDAHQKNFYDVSTEYDTLLILMNGIGIAGSLDQLPNFLMQIKKLITPDGKAYCDSTDIKYLYEEEDGSFWVDLNGSYYGEMEFKMTYESVSNEWFPWLYIDFELLCDYAKRAGLNCEKIVEGANHDYLVALSHI